MSVTSEKPTPEDNYQRKRARTANEEFLFATHCKRGHRLRQGPWDLRICDTCTVEFLEGYRATRA